MRFTIPIAVLTGTILGATVGCGKSAACDLDPTGPYCVKPHITADTPAPAFYVDTGGMLTAHMGQLSGLVEVTIALTQGKTNVELVPESLSYQLKADGPRELVKNNPDGIGAAIVKYRKAYPDDATLSNLLFTTSLPVAGNQLTGWTESPVTVQVIEKGTLRDDGISGPVPLKNRFDFQATPIASAAEIGGLTSYPKFQKVGFVGTELHALMEGGNSGTAQKLFRYQLDSNLFTRMTLGGALADSVQQALVDFASARIFLLANYMNLGLQFYNCPKDPPDLSSCDTPASGLPPGGAGSLLPLTETTALAVAPDSTLAAVAVKGTVYVAAIPPAGTSPKVLAWQAVSENVMDSSAVTQLALAPLGTQGNGLVVMRAGNVWLYGRTANGWTLDPATASLQAAVGNTAVKALAVGDLDNDGLAEVVVVKDTEIIPIAKVGNQFLRGRPLLLPAAKDSIVATAVTIGQVDQTLGNDIVVAYTTKIDNETFSRHLDVFRNKR